MPEAPDAPLEPTRRQWVGFWSMIIQQTQNAFNDKAAQFILVPLAGAIGFLIPVWPGVRVGVESIAGILIALPFVLFAPIAGWLSDRFSKRHVMLGAAIAQLVILASLALAIHWRHLPLALVGFFALAIQSAFFSPAKIGINKELVGSRHLGFAAGIQQMMAMLAILCGQIAAGAWFDHRYQSAGGDDAAAWTAALGPMILLALLAVPAIVMASVIPRTAAHGAGPLRPAVAVQHFAHLKDLWRDLPLRRGAFGVAFFWGFAAFINLWSLKVAKTLTTGGEGFGTLSSWFMAAASLGMILGFGVASFLLRRRIELGWVPLAGAAMTLTSLAMAAIDPTGSLGLLDAAATSAWSGLVAAFDPAVGTFLWALVALAFFAAVFLAPLNAWMQDRYPPAKRGEMQSAVNLQDCLAGILAVAFIELAYLTLHHLTTLPKLAVFRIELAIMGLGCALMTAYIVRLLPGDLARVVGLTLVHLIYRIRPVHPERLPASGGVLLLPNHVTWADAFFLTAASPRPVRFVMDATYMKNPAIRWFCRLFHTVPIALGKPREALRTATAALEHGDVICLFPEGQLTRTGTLRQLKRGFELIARQAGAPVLPVWLDGAWGSIFSYEGHRYFTKIPHRLPYTMQVAFGKSLDPSRTRLPDIRHGLHQASVEALQARLARWQRHDDASTRLQGYQLGLTNALPRRSSVGHLLSDREVEPLGALAGFAKLHRTRLTGHPTLNPGGPTHWIGGQALRQAILATSPGETSAAPGHSRYFFDISATSTEPLQRAGWIHLPCLVIDGVIVAISMPESRLPHASSSPQPGSKPGSCGILLPGLLCLEGDDGLTLSGPTLPDGPRHLPGFRIDAEGFLFPATPASQEIAHSPRSPASA